MTSNVGASTIKRTAGIGFAANQKEKEDSYERMKDNVLEELKKTFRPEFLNRLDDIIVFHSLDEKDIAKIVELMLDSVIKRLHELEINIKYTDGVKEHLAREGFDPAYGARPLRRAITKTVEDKLSEEMLRGTIKKGDDVLMDVEGGSLTFNKLQ
jgi:ATP-dependent Clp protease ATP-binding subunit ClpC